MSPVDVEQGPGDTPVRIRTRPPSRVASDAAPPVLTVRGLLRSRTARRGAVAGVGLVALVALVSLAGRGGGEESLTTDGRITLMVFTTAVWAWVFTKVDDTYVALGAAVVLVLTGIISTEELFETLGDDTVWLLLAAFVIAAGVTSSGLATVQRPSS